MPESRLFERIQLKKARLDALRPLPETAVRRLNEQMIVEWTYHSNAIEGSTLTLRETMLILETGLTVGGKSLREHLEVINHRQAIEYVESLVQERTLLTPFHVRQIHRLVLARIDDASAGQYRQLPVRIAGAAHQPPEAWEVPSRMDAWGAWLVSAIETEHPVVLAALAHHRLVAIHPFIDGNGRTARLAMNLLLLGAGYPPTIILRTDRRQYYRTLSRADRGDEAPFVNFVARAVERSLTLYVEACTPQDAPPPPGEEWLPLAKVAGATLYSQEYLSLLARRGRLEAVKRGRVWYTTRRAVEEYRRGL